MRTVMKHLFLYLLIIYTMGCSEEKPQSLAPVVSLEEVQAITRTGASLNGRVKLNGTGAIRFIRFRYGTSKDMNIVVDCPVEDLHPHLDLVGLTAGITYYYCLEVGNSHATVRTAMSSFVTQPNDRPTVSDLQMVGKGPVSAIIEYTIEDDGGEAITSAGCYFRPEGGKEVRQPVEDDDIQEGEVLKMYLRNLQLNTPYTLQVYAANRFGETRSNVYSFTTGNAVMLTKAGLLAETIGESDKYRDTTLTLAGPLNGTDLCFLRDMMGRDRSGNRTPGNLAYLNLTDASIVEGGESYIEGRYTTADVVGYRLFGGCDRLKNLALPESATSIQSEALEGCTSLIDVRIPSKVRTVGVSTGCTALQKVEVSAANDWFSSYDGVLYDKSNTRIIWFPQGKEDDVQFPDGLTQIGAYAFQGSLSSTFNIPSSITVLGEGAFYASKALQIVLPDGLKSIPQGAFQQCRLLTTLTLGEQTEIVSGYCFDGCESLRAIHIRASLPPVCNEFAFEGFDLAACTLYVPQGTKAVYRSSSWGSFGKIVEE